LTKSLNIGFKYARGEYIARMDGDDICAKERLEKQLKYMREYPSCDFLATRAIIINESGKYIKKTKIDFKGKDIKNYLLDIGSPFVHSSMMIRTKTLEELGGYNEIWQTRQDYELWLRAAFAQKKFAFLNEYLLYFRFHKDSLSISRMENILTNLILRGYYRSKNKGKNIDFKKLREKLEHSEMLKRYTEYINRRRKIKHVIGQAQSLNVKGCASEICELVKSTFSVKKKFNYEKINTNLDYLCSLCEINQHQ
jgi:glycosyltransferase involved in cell wall biosynthesis